MRGKDGRYREIRESASALSSADEEHDVMPKHRQRKARIAGVSSYYIEPV
nr:MAG TPA: hypothetical protein [Caudoviricetes sp.]